MGDARRAETERIRRMSVDHPAADERTPVFDGDDDGTVVVQIGDAHLGAEGQGAMGRGLGADMAAARGASATVYPDSLERRRNGLPAGG